MIRTTARLVALGCACALGGAALAETAEQLIARMGDAVRGRTYVGTLVYVQGDSVETMELVHRVEKGAVRERLTTVSGSRREVICEGDQVRFFLGDERAVLVEGRGDRSALPRALAVDPAQIAAQYRVADLGARSEAGRACRSIGIQPRDGLRYGYRLCLDEDTALPLRTEVLGEDGRKVIEQVVFTHIAFPARIGDAELKPRTDAKGWTWRVSETPAAEAVGIAPLVLGALPAGFAPARALPEGGLPEGHLAFSDGLASVSVFVEPIDAANPGLEGAARMGATNLYGRTVAGRQITVVGEVPAATVRAFAEALAARNARTDARTDAKPEK